MVKNALVSGFIDAGRSLVESLDLAGVDVSAALWLYDAETSDWSLVIGSSMVDSEGARSVYRQIATVFQSRGGTLKPLGRDDVVVKSPSEKPLSLIRLAVRTGARDLSSIRFTQNRINDTLVDDAYIYRMY